MVARDRVIAVRHIAHPLDTRYQCIDSIPLLLKSAIAAGHPCPNLHSLQIIHYNSHMDLLFLMQSMNPTLSLICINFL